MKGFLGDEVLCRYVESEHDTMLRLRWQRRLDGAAVPQKPKSPHRGSDYLLSGILVAKQDLDAGRTPEPLVGHLSGPSGGPKTRYYRHKRGAREYRTGGVYNRMVAADPLEQEMLQIVRDVLLQLPDLRPLLVEKLKKAVAEESAAPLPDLEALREEREAIRRRRNLIVETIDAGTLADVKNVLAGMTRKAEQLDAAIRAAEASQAQVPIDPEAQAEAMIQRLRDQAKSLDELPPMQVKALIRELVDHVVVDLETKEVQVALSLPTWRDRPSQPENADNTMCLDPNLRSQAGHETHDAGSAGTESQESAGRLLLAELNCHYHRIRGSRKPPCYRCHRTKRAA